MPLTSLSWVIFLLLAVVHPFYLSDCSLRHDPATKTLDGSLKLQSHHFSRVIGTSPDSSPDNLVYTYLIDHLRWKVNGRDLEPIYDRVAWKATVCRVVFHFDSVPTLRSLEVDNTLMLSFYPQQKNLMRVTTGDQTRSASLNAVDTSATFIW